MCRCVNRRSVPWFVGALLLVLGIGFSGCSKPPDPWISAKAGQKRVLVTFPPLYCLTHAIAGDDAYVLCFLSTGDGPHDYQFNALDGIKAKGADLLICNGLGLDDAFVDKLNDRARVPTLNVGAALPENMLRPMGDDDDDDEKDAKKDAKHDHKQHADTHHHHGAHDPHIWLGPPEAMVIADAIAAKLAAIDAPHAAAYKKRAEQLKEELQKLLTEGQERFKKNKSRKIVTMHDSIGYFARAFGLDVIDTIQLAPNVPPDSTRLARLETKCKEKGVDAITYEPQYPKSQAELLQKQLKNRGYDVRLAEFDPLETAPLAKDSVNPEPGFYLEKMRANIDNLARALP
jgi:zinc transport system substrate-binding protein